MEAVGHTPCHMLPPPSPAFCFYVVSLRLGPCGERLWLCWMSGSKQAGAVS